MLEVKVFELPTTAVIQIDKEKQVGKKTILLQIRVLTT